MNTSISYTRGAHHVGLTVPDVGETSRFFLDSLGYRQVGARADYPAVFLSDGATMITLWQASAPQRAVAFDRKNVIGLHHLALRVADGISLEELHQRLEAAAGVKIEFAPQPMGDGPTRHLMCHIPGGIRVEFVDPGE